MSDSEVPEEVQKTYAALRRDGLDWAVLSSIPNVTYVSGWDVPPIVGVVPELTGWLPNGLVLLNSRDETGTLIVSDLLAGRAAALNRLDGLNVFEGFGHFEEVDPEQTFADVLGRTLTEAGLAGQKAILGIEPRSLPVAALRVLAHKFSQVETRDAGPSLENVRQVKTQREIGLLRRAVAVADAGQTALIQASADAGQSDLDVWTAIVRVMERQVGHPMTMVSELVTGERTAVVAAGGPIGRQIDPGDTGILDISPRVDGYWADCTNTVVFESEPSEQQLRYFAAAREACESAMQALRPGVRACDVEEIARAAFRRRGFGVAHYAGHQVGVGLNEKPRLVPYDTSVIEAGMVFAVEPGVYEGVGGQIGARAEKMVLVTDSGPDILSGFTWGL